MTDMDDPFWDSPGPPQSVTAQRVEFPKLDRDAIRAKHDRRMLAGRAFCAYHVRAHWPCDEIALLDALEAAEADRDRLAEENRAALSTERSER